MWGTATAGVGDFVVYFPQVAKGQLGLFIETTIVATNTGGGIVTVELDSFNPDLLAPMAFELNANASRTVKIAGGDFQVGWVRLRSSGTVAALTTIVIKQTVDAEEPVSQVSVLGQAPAAKITVPVFRGSPLAEETGVAIAAVTQNDVKLTLHDEDGNLVASRTLTHRNGLTEGDFSDHTSAFLGDLFHGLDEGFSSGSLTLEGPESIPRTLAATALYTVGQSLLPAPVTNVDVPGQYLVQLKSAEDAESTIAEMSELYGFTFLEWVTDRLALVSTSDEQARAVSRDPRVELVEPNVLITI